MRDLGLEVAVVELAPALLAAQVDREAPTKEIKVAYMRSLLGWLRLGLAQNS